MIWKALLDLQDILINEKEQGIESFLLDGNSKLVAILPMRRGLQERDYTVTFSFFYIAWISRHIFLKLQAM